MDAGTVLEGLIFILLATLVVVLRNIYIMLRDLWTWHNVKDSDGRFKWHSSYQTGSELTRAADANEATTKELSKNNGYLKIMSQRQEDLITAINRLTDKL